MARIGTPRENLLITGLYAFSPGDGVLLPLRTMAPLIKDSLDVANSTTAAPASQTSAPQKPAAPSGPTLRADALSLEVPVKVHGSRVTEVARGAAPHTEPFEEETGTMIVFPHGGVLRMSTAVTASQMLVVTNLKTRQDAICRVVKVRTFSNMQGYVEVEFTHQQPGYWGVHFPSEGPAQASVIEPAPVITPAAPVVIPEALINPAPVQAAPTPAPFVTPPPPQAVTIPTPPVVTQAPPPPVVMTPVQPPAPPVAHVASNPPAPVIPAPPSKPEPNFISFGTQEKVQPFASTTTVTAAERIAQSSNATPARTRPEPVLPTFDPETLESTPARDAHSVAAIDLLAAPQAAPPPPSLTMTELRGDQLNVQRGIVAAPPVEASPAIAGAQQPTADAADVPAQSSRAVFGSFSGGTALSGSHAVPVDAFGAHFDSSQDASAIQPGASRSNSWMLIAACVTLLFATVVGGVLYFRPHVASVALNGAANSNSPAVPQPLAFQTPAAVPDASTPEVMPAHNSATHPVSVVAQAPGLTPSIVVNGNNSTSDGPRIVPKPAANLAPGMVKDSSEAHPVSTQRSDADQADQAPALDAAPAADSANAGALSGIVSSNVAAPAAPEIQPEGPVKVGGNVKEPRLISRAMPEYPLVAKQAGIQGDVVVKTTIDQKGNVVNMQIASGPAMLRGPALAALRRWRYEPSTLNGQPISVQMLVTIKFSANR
jgi:TonB family protein